MIDEDRTYENEVRYNNDRLDNRKDRQSIKINIPLDLEGTGCLLYTSDDADE